MMKVICDRASTCVGAGECVHAIEHDRIESCGVWCNNLHGTPIGICIECGVCDIFGDEVEL